MTDRRQNDDVTELGVSEEDKTHGANLCTAARTEHVVVFLSLCVLRALEVFGLNAK